MHYHCVWNRNSLDLTLQLWMYALLGTVFEGYFCYLQFLIRCVVHLHILTSQSSSCLNRFASVGLGSLPLLVRHFHVLASKAKYRNTNTSYAMLSGIWKWKLSRVIWLLLVWHKKKIQYMRDKYIISEIVDCVFARCDCLLKLRMLLTSWAQSVRRR